MTTLSTAPPLAAVAGAYTAMLLLWYPCIRPTAPRRKAALGEV